MKYMNMHGNIQWLDIDHDTDRVYNPLRDLPSKLFRLYNRYSRTRSRWEQTYKASGQTDNQHS